MAPVGLHGERFPETCRSVHLTASLSFEATIDGQSCSGVTAARLDKGHAVGEGCPTL
jgi:hypothetical protein